MAGFSNNPFYSHLSQSGGGFLNDSPADGTTPGGSRKFGQNTSLRAVTSHQLLHHVQQTHGDAEFTLDNIELGPISLVAVLRSVKVQATNTVFTLHDGWGQVEARTWKDGEVSAEDEEELNKADGLEEGGYVYIVGHLKQLHNRKHVSISSIRPVKSHHEVLHHQLEVISAFLYHSRGAMGPDGPSGTIRGGNEDVIMHNVSAYQAGGPSATGSSTVVNDQAANLPPFQRAIYEAIVANRGSNEGVHVGTIARTIQNTKGTKTTAAEVSEALDVLMDEGLVYSTIDETHYDIAT